MTDISKALDLIHRAPARNSHKKVADDEQSKQNTHSKELLHYAILPSKRLRASQLFIELNHLRLKARLSKDDKEDITSNFELWLNDARETLLLFKDNNGEYVTIPAKNRFLSKSLAVEQLKKLEQAFSIALQNNWNAVFLTLTLPPIFPITIQKWLLSFLLHRIKAYIRKREKKTVPHVKVNEPHEDFRLHLHIIIFDINFIMRKHDLTLYLNKHVENFLTDLGEHYKRTINKRADDDVVIALNRYGKHLLRKYRAYKRSKKGFTGPINHLSAIKQINGSYVFQNAPADAKKVAKTMNDGGQVSVFDYIKFYVIKNVSEASKIASADESKPIKLVATELAFYWYARLPFFTLSPPLRQPRPPRQNAGWTYIGTIRKDEAPTTVLIKSPLPPWLESMQTR